MTRVAHIVDGNNTGAAWNKVGLKLWHCTR